MAFLKERIFWSALLACCLITVCNGFGSSDILKDLTCDFSWFWNGKNHECPKTLLNSPINTANDCECGVTRSFGQRIVGGVEAKPHEFPWMVEVIGNSYCGGSLINDRYVLTAGHCFASKSRGHLTPVTICKDINMNIGHHNLDDKNKVKRKCKKLIIHPNYNPLTYYGDIALIQMDEAVKFAFEVEPICLDQSGVDLTGMKALITGWGLEQEGGFSRSSDLKKATTQLISLEKCMELYSTNPEFVHSNNSLCAYQLDIDTCSGDSGGPIATEMKDNKYFQVGITSSGYGCANPDYPGLYTKVNQYIDWIYRNTEDALYCVAEY